MAAGLFASLFAGSSSSSGADSPSSASKTNAQSQTRQLPKDDEKDDSFKHSRTPSDETGQHSGSSSDQDVVMLHVTTPAVAVPTSIATQQISSKEAQEVADVDMELSSPPSSPPPSAPPTPQSASASLPAPQSANSGPVRTLSSDSPLSTPTPEAGPSTGRAASASTPTVQRTSRRRMMPARLSQVSSLLAGSMLEEELLLIDQPSSPSSSSFPHHTTSESSKSNGANSSLAVARRGSDSSHIRSAPSRIFTTSSIIVLTSDAKALSRAVYPYATTADDDSSAGAQIKTEKEDIDISLPTTAATPSKAVQTSGFIRPPAPSNSSVISTLAIKRQQLIETPDFKPRDDTLYMPKTRGLRSEAAEDTSDAAYERRHRKPETAEKRQRKAEVDRLSRDRQKLLSRIEQLKTVEARMLQPIVVAIDQVRAEAAASNGDQDQQLQAPTKPLHERIEDVRKELLADAYETLKRYDLLLSTSNDAKPASPGPSTLPNKADTSLDKAAAATAVVDDINTRSQSPRLKIRIKGGRATWETAESASPTANKQSPASIDKSDTSRRHSARQPKHRVESLPTPLTAAAVEAVEEGRRKRRRSSGAQAEETSPTQKKGSGSAAHDHEIPTKGRAASDAISPERRTRRRGSPEVGGTYKGKSNPKEEAETSVDRSNGRPKRATAAAAAVASARQRQYAERSFSDFDYEDEVEEVESALDDASAPSSPTKQRSPLRHASHSLRQSPVKPRDYRSPSASSTTSTVSSMASSIGYMYPTVPDTGSLKVSQSLAEIQATDPEAISLSPVAATEGSPSRGDGARKKLKIVLSRSPSETGLDGETQKALTEALDLDSEERGPAKREKGRGFGGALTESEAEMLTLKTFEAMSFKLTIAAVLALAAAGTTSAAPVSSAASADQCVSLGKGAFGYNSTSIGIYSNKPPGKYLSLKDENVVASSTPQWQNQTMFEFFNCSYTPPPYQGKGSVETYQGYIKGPDGNCVTVDRLKQTGVPVKSEPCSFTSDSSLGNVEAQQHWQIQLYSFDYYYTAVFLGDTPGPVDQDMSGYGGNYHFSFDGADLIANYGENNPQKGNSGEQLVGQLGKQYVPPIRQMPACKLVKVGGMELVNTSTGEAQPVNAGRTYAFGYGYSPLLNATEQAEFNFYQCDSAYMGYESDDNNIYGHFGLNNTVFHDGCFNRAISGNGATPAQSLDNYLIDTGSCATADTEAQVGEFYHLSKTSDGKYEVNWLGGQKSEAQKDWGWTVFKDPKQTDGTSVVLVDQNSTEYKLRFTN
ncbi:hypothetical protein NDA16_002920 [Ustilago loliicola]|nr:hypothetical protein NDA16_002920 [Ustilago loliicola]